jgi:hypothetical protein
MIPRAFEILLRLLSRPTLPESSVVRQSVRRVLLVAERGDVLLKALAKRSPARAREVLTWADDLLDYWEKESRAKLIGSVEEEREGRRLATLSDDELQARATLHVLLPREADGMASRTRSLALGLEARFPELAASTLLHLSDDDNLIDDCEELRQRLMLRLQDSAPLLAAQLVDSLSEAQAWLERLLESPASDHGVIEILIGRVSAHRALYQRDRHEFLALARQVTLWNPTSGVAFLTAGAYRLRKHSDSESLQAFLSVGSLLPSTERRSLGEALQTKIAATLPKALRHGFLRRLVRWLRPVLHSPDDPLHRALQADRAIALLMHLKPHRLAATQHWEKNLAPPYRRRFVKRRNALWQDYLQRRKLALQLAGILEAIANQRA